MPSVKFFGYRGYTKCVQDVWTDLENSLPEELAKEIAIVIVSSTSQQLDGKDIPYVEIHASRETNPTDVELIGGVCLRHMDVELYHPDGSMTFLEKKDHT